MTLESNQTFWMKRGVAKRGRPEPFAEGKIGQASILSYQYIL